MARASLGAAFADSARARLERLQLRAASGPSGDVLADRDTARKLHGFIKLAWSLVEPRPYVDNWHIGAISEHLEAVSSGQLERLIINIPPGSMKSLSVSVFWPAWVWRDDPAFKWIFASYSVNLARRDAVRMRDLIESPWFHERFSGVALHPEKRKSTEYWTTRGGFRFSTSPGAGVTGYHADCQVVDDPIKPQDATETRSKIDRAQLAEVLSWWTQTMTTRLADPEHGRRVIVMQRLHDLDLSGAMKREGGYEHLFLPMEFNPKRICITSLGKPDPRKEEGELLFPARYPKPVVEKLKKDLGPTGSAAQLDQSPLPPGGGLFKLKYFKPRWRAPLPVRGLLFIQSWDMRFKDDAESGDYVVGQVWAAGVADAAEYYLIDQVRGRWSFEETLMAVLELSRKWPQARTKLVENKANGPSVQNALRKRVPGIRLVDPQGGKVDRANASEPLWAAGNVRLPEDAEWTPDFIQEHIKFPKGQHDDQVDAGTQALSYLYAKSHASYVRAMEAIRAGRF